MRFIDGNGRLIDLYQSITQLPDEQWGAGNLFNNFKILLDRSVDDELYTLINANLHTDRWNKWSRKEALQLMDYANRRSVPMWPAERVVRFLQKRNAIRFGRMNWSNNELSFGLRVPFGGDEVTLMLPKTFGDKTLSLIFRDGAEAPYTFQPVKGHDYAMIAATAGDHELLAKYSDGH